MYTPVFPFKGNQIILSSDRIILNSKTDSIFLFGSEAVGLSSKKTINLDANEKILLDSQKIQLGHEAETIGEPIVLGQALSRKLIKLLNNLSEAGVLLAQASESNPGASMQQIALAGQKIYKGSRRLTNILRSVNNPILSKTTFTR